jgi:uncharacterized membrane protein
VTEANVRIDDEAGSRTQTQAETEAGAEDVIGRRPRWSRLGGRPHLWGVGTVALLTAVLQGALGFQQFKQYYMGAYDLVIFDQAIRNYAHGHMPVSQLKDVHDAAQIIPGYGHPFSILGDHFSPILASAAPLYWLWDNPLVLVIAQALLFGAAVPSVWAFTRRAVARIAPERYAVRVAYLVGIAFGISWPLQMASQAGFHEVGFFVVLSAVMIERYQAGRLGPAIGFALALLLVKEDCGYVVAAFGLLLLITRRGRWRLAGGLLAVGGVGAALAIERWWLPTFGGRLDYYWYYGQLGPNLPSAIWKIVSDPVYAFHVASRPGDKVHTLLYLLWPLLFCCLLSPLSILAVPLIVERAFSDKPEHWRTDQHYNAFLAVILTTAAVDGAVRLWGWAGRLRDRRAPEREGPAPRTAGRWALGWAGFVLAGAVVLVFQYPMPLGSVFSPNSWRANGFTTAANQALAEVPSGDGCVEADNDFAPHLSSRTEVLLLDLVPHGCPWVVLQTAAVSYPFSGPAVEQSRAQWLAADGYQLVFSSNQVFVYHRP